MPFKLTREKRNECNKLFRLLKKNKTTVEDIEKILRANDFPINITNTSGDTLIYSCAKYSTNIPLLDWLYKQGCPFKDTTTSDTPDPMEGAEDCYNTAVTCAPYNSKNTLKLHQWFEDKGICLTKVPSFWFINTYTRKSMDKLQDEWFNILGLTSRVYSSNGTSNEHANFLTFIDAHIDILKRDDKGNTYLHILVKSENSIKDVTPIKNKKLLKNYLKSLSGYQKRDESLGNYFFKYRDTHIDIDAQNNDGDTAAHISARKHHLNQIKTLYLYGANFDIPNNDGVIARDEFIKYHDSIPYNRGWENSKTHIEYDYQDAKTKEIRDEGEKFRDALRKYLPVLKTLVFIGQTEYKERLDNINKANEAYKHYNQKRINERNAEYRKYREMLKAKGKKLSNAKPRF